MSLTISSVGSGTLSAPSSAASNTAPTAPAQPVQQSTNNSVDTVRLTAAQQVYQLYNQGQKVSQIASSLSLSVAAVNGYLNLSNTTG